MNFLDRKLKIIIILILFVNLFINEFTLINFTIDHDIDFYKKVKIRLFNILFFLLPFFYLFIKFFKKKLIKFFNNIKHIYLYSSVLVFSLILLFVTINLLVILDNSLKERYQEDQAFIHSSKMKYLDENFFRKVYPNYNKDEIKKATDPIKFSGHPSLEFIVSPNNDDFYETGPEGARSSKYVNEDNFYEIINNSTWVFGGSTLFGVGVKKNETIVYYLNKLDNKNNYINFGVPSYSQNREIKRLLLLLNKGFKPKKIIFLDGLNDIENLNIDNFHPVENSEYLFNSYSFFYNIDSFLKNFKLKIKVFLYSLPVVSLIPKKIDEYNYVNNNKNISNNGYLDVYSRNSFYHDNPWGSFHFSNKVDETNIEALYDKLIMKWRLNSEFLNYLSRGFKFEHYVFLQPFGTISDENPFITDIKIFKKSNLYKKYLDLSGKLTNDIKNNTLENYYDLSNADEECKECYVDFTHYNSKLNEIIAKKTILTLNN